MRNLFVLLATTPTPVGPSDTPSLRPGLNADQVSPGFLGFLATFFVAALLILLIVDMVRRIRRVRYRAEVAERQLDGGQDDNGQDDGDSAQPDAHGDGVDGVTGAVPFEPTAPGTPAVRSTPTPPVTPTDGSTVPDGEAVRDGSEPASDTAKDDRQQ